MKEYDIVIIGGGPVGLAAAVAARDHGTESILILEHDGELGGTLSQCIHNGFGPHTFEEELTGPERAARYEGQVFDRGVEYKLDTMVMDTDRDKMVTAMGREKGLFEVRAKAVILVMGCRECSRGALNIPGYRPAGIFSAGTAQYPVNMEGFMSGREVVTLGSGDTGLIVARRMILEGAEAKVAAGLMSYFGGLKRNIAQCLNDCDIPLRLSHMVIDTRGKEKLTGITLAVVDEKGKPILGTEEDYDCDTLLLSVGLIPENELSGPTGVETNRVTSGLIVNESLETSVEGVSACGNVFHVHDLVDFASEEAAAAGKDAARYVMEGEMDRQGHEINLKAVDGVRHTVSCTVNPQRVKNTQVVRFRVGNVYKSCYIGVYLDDEQVIHGKRPVTAPGEMEETKPGKEKLLLHPELKTITIKVEEAQITEKRELICIGCPMGCPLTVELGGGGILSITGHTRRRGEVYARKEVTNPTRIVTSTVDVEGGKVARASVKIKGDILKEKIFQYVKALKEVTVKTPVHIDDMIVANVVGTGVDIVATRDA